MYNTHSGVNKITSRHALLWVEAIKNLQCLNKLLFFYCYYSLLSLLSYKLKRTHKNVM